MTFLLPPALFAMTAALMGLTCWALGLDHHVPYPWNLSGLPLLLGGIGLAQAAKGTFRKLHTNVNTFEDPDILITEGFYRRTRNPMYLGLSIGLAGCALLFQGSWLSFLLAGVFVAVTDRWHIRFEEQRLLQKFGDAYTMYCGKTRRWV